MSPGVASPLNEAKGRPTWERSPRLPWEIVVVGVEGISQSGKLCPICSVDKLALCLQPADAPDPPRGFVKWAGVGDRAPDLAGESNLWVTSKRVACCYLHTVSIVVQSEGEWRVFVCLLFFDPVPMWNPSRLMMSHAGYCSSKPSSRQASGSCYCEAEPAASRLTGKSRWAVELSHTFTFFRIASSWTYRKSWLVERGGQTCPSRFASYFLACFRLCSRVVAEAAWSGCGNLEEELTASIDMGKLQPGGP